MVMAYFWDFKFGRREERTSDWHLFVIVCFLHRSGAVDGQARCIQLRVNSKMGVVKPSKMLRSQ